MGDVTLTTVYCVVVGSLQVWDKLTAPIITPITAKRHPRYSKQVEVSCLSCFFSEPRRRFFAVRNQPFQKLPIQNTKFILSNCKLKGLAMISLFKFHFPYLLMLLHIREPSYLLNLSTKAQSCRNDIFSVNKGNIRSLNFYPGINQFRRVFLNANQDL